jgi:hypothetical protein
MMATFAALLPSKAVMVEDSSRLDGGGVQWMRWDDEKAGLS